MLSVWHVYFSFSTHLNQGAEEEMRERQERGSVDITGAQNCLEKNNHYNVVVFWFFFPEPKVDFRWSLRHAALITQKKHDCC